MFRFLFQTFCHHSLWFKRGLCSKPSSISNRTRHRPKIHCDVLYWNFCYICMYRWLHTSKWWAVNLNQRLVYIPISHSLSSFNNDCRYLQPYVSRSVSYSGIIAQFAYVYDTKGSHLLTELCRTPNTIKTVCRKSK